VLPFGSSTVTGWCTTASDCIVASRSTVTTSWVEVVCRIGWALAPAPPDPPDPADADAAAAALAVPPPAAPPPPPPPRPAAAVDDPPPERPPPVPEPLLAFCSSSVSAFSRARSAASCCLELAELEVWLCLHLVVGCWADGCDPVGLALLGSHDGVLVVGFAGLAGFLLRL